MVATTIEAKVKTAIDKASSEATKLAKAITDLIKGSPGKIVENINKTTELIEKTLSELKESTKENISALLKILENGVYFDPNIPFPTDTIKPDKSYFFLPTAHGVVDGIWYDAGDVVFYSAKKKRIYVIAPKDYVTSIKVSGEGSSKSLAGEVVLTTKNLGIVEKTTDSNTPYLRKNGTWVNLYGALTKATSTNYGVAKVAKDGEDNSENTFITLRQLFQKIALYLTYENLVDGVTYVVTSEGFVVAPEVWKEVIASYTEDGIVSYLSKSALESLTDATTTEKKNPPPDRAVKPSQFVALMTSETAGVKSIKPRKPKATPGSKPGLKGRKDGKWKDVADANNINLLGLKEATTLNKGVVKLADTAEIVKGTIDSKAVSTEFFKKYIEQTPLYKTADINTNGTYLYDGTSWVSLVDKIRASEKLKGVMKYVKLTDLKDTKKTNELLAIEPKTLLDYLSDKVDIYREINPANGKYQTHTVDDNTLYGFKDGDPFPVEVPAIKDRHATLTDLGVVRKANYKTVRTLIEKVLSNTELTADEQSQLAEMSDDIIDLEFLNKFLDDFKIADPSFMPPGDGTYGIYNGQWLEITGTENVTELQRPDGSRKTEVRDTTTYYKNNLSPPDSVGVEGDICHVLDTHTATSIPVKQAAGATATSNNPTATWTDITETYYLDKVQSKWVKIKATYVKVRSRWERVTKTKYKTA